MPDLQKLLTDIGTALLPNGIELVFLIIGVGGMVVAARAMFDAYYLALEGGGRGRGQPGFGSVVMQFFIGSAMVLVPVLLWRAADALIDGAGSTYSSVLAYVSGVPETGYCDQFVAVLHLAFMLVGAIGILMFFLNWLDQVRGFNPKGFWQGLIWGLGGLGCFLIVDIVEITANTLNVDTGFEQVCKQLGSP